MRGSASRSDAADIEARLTAADPALGKLIAAVTARIGPQRIEHATVSPFEALVRAIVYQSVSTKAAAAIYARIRAAIGSPLTPKKLLAMPPDPLKALGLSTAKATCIHRLADWFTANPKLAWRLPSLSDDEVTKALTLIPGIGVWTVNVFLIFNLRRPDVMPATDLVIRRGVELIYGMTGAASPALVHEKALCWQPYRSIASLYLWNATRLKLTAADLS